MASLSRKTSIQISKSPSRSESNRSNRSAGDAVSEKKEAFSAVIPGTFASAPSIIPGTVSRPSLDSAPDKTVSDISASLSPCPGESPSVQTLILTPREKDEEFVRKGGGCQDLFVASDQKKESVLPVWNQVSNRLGYKLYLFLEDPESSASAKCWSLFIMVTILLSITCFVLETHPSLTMKYETLWFVIEAVTTCIFLAEYIMRISVCRMKGSVREFLANKLNMCDFLAICPFFIDLISRGSNSTQALRVCRVVRLARVLRLFKLGKKSLGVQVLYATCAESTQALKILALWLLLSLVLFSSGIFYAEKYNCNWHFDNKPDFLAYQENCREKS